MILNRKYIYLVMGLGILLCFFKQCLDKFERKREYLLL